MCVEEEHRVAVVGQVRDDVEDGPSRPRVQSAGRLVKGTRRRDRVTAPESAQPFGACPSSSRQSACRRRRWIEPIQPVCNPGLHLGGREITKSTKVLELFAAGEFVKTGGSSGRYPIDALIASRSDTGFPLIHASPSVGRVVSDVNIRIVVVFRPRSVRGSRTLCRGRR